MIKIKKSKSGFRVQYLGRNSEILAVSEVLSSKANAWKNVKAMIGIFKQNVTVEDADKTYVMGYDYELEKCWKLKCIKERKKQLK